jgi:hypothetical protein
MSAALVILVLVALFAGWFFWPSIAEHLDQARRLRHIDRLRRQTLNDLDYLAERAARTRAERSRRRLDEIVDDIDP